MLYENLDLKALIFDRMDLPSLSVWDYFLSSKTDYLK